uniref:Uncharacterized protein At1g01500 n=1 Tax=Anthurium amnicola TaxID=1678845 RepID=A0A1D1YFX4_9ARAE
MGHPAEDDEVEKRVDSASATAAASCSSKWNHSGYRGGSPPSPWLEIRLFYVRISPCAADSAPSRLTLAHLRREAGVALEINGARVPAAEPTSVLLRKDRVDRGAAEVTYVSTGGVRLSGAVDFEVRDGDGLLLCGVLERMEVSWGNGAARDPKTGWSMDCYSPASLASSALTQTKLGGSSSPSIEVYVAGCCSGFPLILTQTIRHNPRGKAPRQGMLDAVPEDDEMSGRDESSREGLIHRGFSSRVAEGEADDDSEIKASHSFYAEGDYYDDDGQLSWFNAGVRVGVGIGLGMCLGVGIGVGLLMHSYQATKKNLRRRFF